MCRYCHFDYQCCITFSVKSRLHDKFSFGSKIYSEKLDKYFSRRQKTETSWPSIFVSSMYIVCVHNTTSMRVFSVFLFVCLVQPRSQGFSLKKWVGLWVFSVCNCVKTSTMFILSLGNLRQYKSQQLALLQCLVVHVKINELLGT